MGMWAGEATPLLGPEGPLPARGRDDPSVLRCCFISKNPTSRILHERGFLFYQLRLKAHDGIFNTLAAEGVDVTCSLPQ